MFSCICPHAGEEIWNRLGHSDTIAYEKWPEFDAEAVKENEIEIGVQVNGKVKGVVLLGVAEDKDSALSKAKAVEGVAKFIEGKSIVKEIYVPGKIVNIVVK